MFLEHREVIKAQMQHYEPYSKEIEEVLESEEVNAENDVPVWVQQLPDDVEEDDESLKIGLDPALLINAEVPPSATNPKSHTVTPSPTIMQDSVYYNHIASFNIDQISFLQYIHKWCFDVITADRQNYTLPKPFFVHLSGGAGVGKTHLIHGIYQTVVRQLRCVGKDPDSPTIALTASTGMAASHIGGTTLHSAFLLPVKQKNQLSLYKKPHSEKLNQLKNQWKDLKILVIDEISMIGLTTFDHLNQSLQDIMECPDTPFGGVSIVAVGDFFQLNPVADRTVYSTPPGYAALIGSLWTQHFKLHELKEIMRQRDDPEYAEALSRIRTGDWTVNDLQMLTDLEKTDTTGWVHEVPYIYFTNKKCDDHHQTMLAQLEHHVQQVEIVAQDSTRDCNTGTCEVTVTGGNIHDTGGLPSKLVVCEGARFMLVKNIDIGDKLVNGSIGTIAQIDIQNLQRPLEGRLLIRFDDPCRGMAAKQNSPLRDCVPIHPVTTSFVMKGARSVTVERKMFPGILAWSITAYKSQGNTFTRFIADLSMPLTRHGKEMGARDGLAYTVVSRGCKRAGVKLLHFDPRILKVNQAAKTEISRMRQFAALECGPTFMPEVGCLNIAHVNITSLRAHHHHFMSNPIINQFMNCIICTETRISHLSPEVQQSLSDHRFNAKLHPDGARSRGMAVLHQDHLPITASHIPHENLNIMQCAIEHHGATLCFSALYRPPSSHIPTFVNELDIYLNHINQSYSHIIVMGDFNMDLYDVRHNYKLSSPGMIFNSSFHLPLISKEEFSTSSLPILQTSDLDSCHSHTLITY